MATLEDIPTGHIGAYLRVERPEGVRPQVILYPSRELHDERAWQKLLTAAGFHAKSDAPLRWRHNPMHTDYDALQAALEWARAYTGVPRVTPISDGAYGHFAVSSQDDGSYLVACPYGKQAPLKRIGAEFDYDSKAWRVLPHLAGRLRGVLDRAVARAVDGAAAVADALADITTLSTPHITVTRYGDTARLSCIYSPDAIRVFKLNGGTWDAHAKTWNFRIINQKSYDTLRFVIEAASPHVAEDAAEQARATERRAAARAALADSRQVERRERERLRAERETAPAAPRAPRRAFVADNLPPLGVALRAPDKSWIVYTGYGRRYEIDEDMPSYMGSQFLGHEGDYACDVTYRPATSEEAAAAETAEAERAAREAERRERLAVLRQAFDHIEAAGEYPQGSHDAQGVAVYLSERDRRGQIYGSGRYLVLGEDWLWAVSRNGMDGDDWSRNNVRTGGAGAIGRRIPADAALAAQVLAAGRALELTDETTTEATSC